MPTTTDEFTYAQSWIGTVEEKPVFDERFDRQYAVVVGEGQLTFDTDRRKEALNRSIEESMRGQLAVYLFDQPSSASAEGNSYSNVQNIVALQDTIRRLSSAAGGSMAGNVAQSHRHVGR
jgi:hypothetical protein